MAFESPFEKGGTRGICLGTPWENPPSPPFRKGGILFTDKRLVVHLLQLLQDRLALDHHLVPLVRAPQADREHAALVDLLDDARRGDPVTRPDRGGELHLL